MPKLYEYFGIVVFFYSNEHEPVHVHGKHQGRESRADLTIVNGIVTAITIAAVAGRRPLEGTAARDFEALVKNRAPEIVQKWIDYFVLHRPVEPQVITRRVS
jgi:hypothetical protein